METNEVNFAFEILLEEIEGVVNALNKDGAAAFQKGDYEKARGIIEDATRFTTFREKVQTLQKEWGQLHIRKVSPTKTQTPSKRQSLTAKLKRGLRTTENSFREPILEALQGLGGSARMNDVLNRIEKTMKSALTPHDYQPLPSDPKQIRWRNTAQWCRNTLVNEGLMKKDSPWGIWEISSMGVDALKKMK